ncbi:translation initiation factor IF-3 [Zafaria sp. J156]|uniref:translation initiation factor IF-3 n=1 Tax=Zafaria sp. J156 TaxID=3116490 RepID=UPI002E76F98E|nr:translation initiation factor IF-3 [Zafaria sp. J156]MEE1621988.1 translation initiation factor IF-3 [Zafaria sp. J156]
MNDRIRVPEVRLVGPNGEQVGVVRIEDALRLAAESDLDLVEVAPTAKPPVCKLMDFGKYKYEAAVKAREARKNQTNTVLKEIRFRLKIDKHDYETKTGHALRFLSAGDKVKAMIQFRGREQQRPEMGIRLLNKFAEDVASVGIVESTPRIDGRNMVMVVGPLKNKAEAKAEARRQAQREQDKAKAAAGKERVDTDADRPAMSQSLGDALPEGLKAQLAANEAAADEAVVDEAVAEPAAAEAPAAEDVPVAAEPAEEKPAQPVETAPVQPRAAAKPAAEVKPVAKPAAEAKPAAAKPAVAAPKPAAKPAPKPAAAAPRPAPKPAPRSSAKPGPAK